MHTPGGSAHVNHQNYEDYYQNNSAESGSGKKYHEAVLELYFKAADEAQRVLRSERELQMAGADARQLVLQRPAGSLGERFFSVESPAKPLKL